MKKILFLAPLAALALASCSNEDLDETSNNVSESSAITFTSVQNALTRADHEGEAAATDLNSNFVVYGIKGDASDDAATKKTLVFDHYNVNYAASTANTTLSNTKGWEYVNQSMVVRGVDASSNDGKLATTATQQTIKYWDHAAKSYDFLAFSMGTGDGAAYATPTAVNKANLGTSNAAYTLTGTAAQLSNCYISDITTVEEASYSSNAVVLNFRHLTSKVRLALYETVPGYVVSDIKFRETITTSHAPATSTNGVLIGTNAFNEKGTLSVYFPTTGTTNKSNSDYNKAHVSFAADATDGVSSKKTFGAVDYKTVSEDAITSGSYLGLTSSTASYVKDAAGTAGAYTTVLPHENDSKVLSIQIDYTLTATDGSGETINVYGAEADVPAAYTAWKSGYAYTYIFKISQNTNGHTGSEVDDKGLTAISFDAVVLNDEANGLQETITTVSTPSITTYGYNGTSVVGENEYQENDEIYATVQDGTEAKAATNLYTVTLTAGTGAAASAAQTINEASVANCIANGGSVKDANGWTLAVTGVSGTPVASVPTSSNTSISVPALKWWAGASGTIYAVEYVKGTEKYYKIVRIQ